MIPPLLVSPNVMLENVKYYGPPLHPDKGTSNLCEGSLKWKEVRAWGKGFPLP